MNINQELLLYLNNLASKSEILKDLVYVFSDAPIFIIPLFLIFSWFYYSFKKDNRSKKNLLFIFYSTLIWVFFALVIQNLVFMERPEKYLESSSNLLLNHLPDASFPSDHAVVAFSFLFSLFYCNYKKLFYTLLPIFSLMVVSRVMAWIHWPFDILAWSVLWFFSSFITFKFIKKSKKIDYINNFLLKISHFLKL